MRTCLKGDVCKPRDNVGITYATGKNSKIRLRGVRDHSWMSPDLNSSITDIASFNRRFTQKVYHPLKELTKNSQKVKQLKNKHDLYKSLKVDTRSVREIKCLPVKFKKLMIPRNIPKNNIDSSNSSCVKGTTNIKKTLGDSQKKKLQSRLITVWKTEKNTLDKTKLENISKISILLLYLHFLLCYYLSFSKTKQFVELFEMCPVNDKSN